RSVTRAFGIVDVEGPCRSTASFATCFEKRRKHRTFVLHAVILVLGRAVRHSAVGHSCVARTLLYHHVNTRV
ncbi:MAG TPA: hypothetical protein VFA89_11120, partial [Terriglobales bacterium]|nr:hypothetical protein [Terriglobales bacterium]